MRLSERVAGAALAVLVAATGSLAAAPPDGGGELDAVRQECIGASRDTQARERAVAALEHEIGLLDRDAEGRQRDLDESRTEQAHLLGTLTALARNPPEEPSVAPGGPIERSRGELLLRGTLTALHAEARALSGEIERIATLHAQTAAKNGELASARQALEADRLHLAELTARRLALSRRFRPEAPGGDARIAALGREANDVGDLIKRADAAAERRDKDELATEHRDKEGRARVAQTKGGAPTAEATDPTRPSELHPFDPPGSVLLMPVAGAITRGFGVTDAATASGAASQGLSLAALPGAEAVAPFDGRVVYAGPFRDLGLVLIIRHSSLYHSLLAGLQRVDVTADQWVLAGEPVGAMLGTDGSTLDFELRRDGHPVDPQPWLAPDGQGRDDGRDDGRHARRNEPDGDQKVRE